MKLFRDRSIKTKLILPLFLVTTLGGAGIVAILISEQQDLTGKVLPAERALLTIGNNTLEILSEYRELMTQHNDDALEEIDEAFEELVSSRMELEHLIGAVEGEGGPHSALTAAIAGLRQAGNVALSARSEQLAQARRLEQLEEAANERFAPNAAALDGAQPAVGDALAELGRAHDAHLLMQSFVRKSVQYLLSPNDEMRETAVGLAERLEGAIDGAAPGGRPGQRWRAVSDEERAAVKQLLEAGANALVMTDGYLESLEALEDAEDEIDEVLGDFRGVVENITAEAFHRSLVSVGTIVLGILALAAGINLLSALSISRRAGYLTQAATLVGQGELSVRTPVESRDELGSLSRSFNEMTEMLQASVRRRAQAEDELKSLNRSLEAKVKDRTAKVEAQARDLQEALSKQIEYSDLQREFVSMASHEFRTPLTIIDGRAQRIWRKVDQLSDEEILKNVGAIRSAVSSMLTLIESTLTAEKLEAGKIELNREPVDIVELLKLIQGQQLETSPDSEINLQLEDLPDEIQGDSNLLEQAFSNLVSNAVKYSNRNGRVEILGRTEGDDLLVSVTDDGVGIPADQQSRLFQRYFRARTAIGIPGTGIGLHVVKRFIEMHGGDVTVQSVEGEGSTFTVRLPISWRSSRSGEEADGDDRAPRDDVKSVA